MTIDEAYITLGLTAESATPKTIRARFRRLVHTHHPDKAMQSFPREGGNNPETLQRIVEAYQLLRDVDGLHTYDKRLAPAAYNALQLRPIPYYRAPPHVPGDFRRRSRHGPFVISFVWLALLFFAARGHAV